MTGQRQQDKQRTRARISEHATRLFLARGFDAVTVAEVAEASGVSKVTVFAHFPRKEDLLLDLAPEATRIVRAAVLGQAEGHDAIEALRSAALGLAENGHALSGLTAGNEAFVRTVAASPALLARAWELLAELEAELADALATAPNPPAHPRLVAALVIAAYRSIVAESIRLRREGVDLADVVADHRARLGQAFDALQLAVARLGQAR